MRSFIPAAAIAIVLPTAPAMAQGWAAPPSAYERGYSRWQSPRSAAISRGTVAETAAANDHAATEAEAPWRTTRRSRHEAAANALAYVRAQRAYAMAMDDWHAQVEACEAGVREACAAPTPDPANYDGY